MQYFVSANVPVHENNPPPPPSSFIRTSTVSPIILRIFWAGLWLEYKMQACVWHNHRDYYNRPYHVRWMVYQWDHQRPNHRVVLRIILNMQFGGAGSFLDFSRLLKSLRLRPLFENVFVISLKGLSYRLKKVKLERRHPPSPPPWSKHNKYDLPLLVYVGWPPAILFDDVMRESEKFKIRATCWGPVCPHCCKNPLQNIPVSNAPNE